jgi:hypothetical protein
MAYSPDIPQATDQPSQSQPLLLANFQSIDALVNVNHVDFDDANQGMHKFLQMPEQSAAPTTAANVGGLYTKEINSTTQLFYREESNGTQYQITGGATAASADGQVYLQGGLIMKWGVRSITTPSTTVTFATAFPTNCFNVQLTQATVQSNTFLLNSISTTGFVVNKNTAAGSVYFIAIGN